MEFEVANLEKKLAALQKERDTILKKLSRIRDDSYLCTSGLDHKKLVRAVVELENDLEVELATREDLKTGIPAMKKNTWNELILMDSEELKKNKRRLEERIAQSRLNQPVSWNDNSSSEDSATYSVESRALSSHLPIQTSDAFYSSTEDTSTGSVDSADLDSKWHENYSTGSDDDTYSSCVSSPFDTSMSSD